MKIILHAFIGMFTGSFLGLVAVGFVGENIFGYSLSNDNYGLILFGIVLGGIPGAILAVVGGSWELHGRFKHTVNGTLIGCVLGVLMGQGYAFYITADDDSIMREKNRAHYQGMGLDYGLPIGTVLGGVAGFTLRAKENPKPV